MEASTFRAGTGDRSSAPISGLPFMSGVSPGDQVGHPGMVSNSGGLELRYTIQRWAVDPDATECSSLRGLERQHRAGPVRRSSSLGGPYTKVNGPAVSPSDYVYAGLTDGTTDYFIVTAVDTGSNESGNSSEASATPVAGVADGTYHARSRRLDRSSPP